MKPILFIALTFALASCQHSDSEQTSAQNSAYKIATTSGVTQGRANSSQKGASAKEDAAKESAALDVVGWFDIPYAQPPLGDLRWRAPRPLLTPEAAIAEKESTACVQPASNYGGAEGEGIVGAEDCLYLDIRAPHDFAGKNYPVMVWIHGGGNKTGLKDYYDFSTLVAGKKVVVVALNYRLGALGWFSHPAIQGLQEGADKAANFGTLDLIQGLSWVRDNIAQFGGDAENVTIFGESAGGHNVYTLLASPLAKGLFHKAIAQSGYTASSTLEDAYNREGADRFVTRGSWQVTNDLLAQEQAAGQDTLAPEVLYGILKGTDARQFIALYAETSDADFTPLTTADGVVVPLEGLEAALGNPEYAKNVPVMSGANKDEVTLWLGLHRYFMATSYPFTKLLPPKVTIKNPELYQFWVRTRSHAWKVRGVDVPLTALENAGYQQLYAYRFDWDDQEKSFFIDFPNILGAAHGTDISFVTGDFKYGPITSYIYPEGEARDQMQRTVQNAWGDFAATATPDNSLPFSWQRFTSAGKAYIHLDKDAFLRPDRETDTLDSLLAKVAADSHAQREEKCLMVWDTLVNIGDRDIERYNAWNNGQCASFDALTEQSNMVRELIEKYGSTSVL